jgi:propionyl-CoA carboxylase alpha chain
MFKKILIANRGEIACRIIRTARRMGIKTVAVYSEADRHSLHARLADEAVHIGPAPSAQSYLVAENIIAACRETGAEAVHPGFGFLSERAAFAEALQQAGVTFIGPGVHAINSMGDKIRSKLLAQKAGVSTIPGFTGTIENADHAVKIARDIGYPVMLKASAGGGGKGMRIVRSDTECREGFQSATNEAVASFGDGRVFAEKFIEDPRHVEIQVLADQHGNVIYLGERECSIQRRHQKIVEEAPSVALTPALRQEMAEAALAGANLVGYVNAGTIEFLLDDKRNFYFMEMNTRIQVEHPVTENITGIDMIKEQIKVAAGEPLPYRQEDIKILGHSIECRVNAEDPVTFAPSPGTIRSFNLPGGPGIRVDTAAHAECRILPYYDSLIAKVISRGRSRAEALSRIRRAMDSFIVEGI